MYIILALYMYPPHSVLWSHCKWNQSNFFSHQNPSLCVAKLEFKCIDTFRWCLQKWPRKGAWLLVLEIGFWADIEKLRIFQCENWGFGMFDLVWQPVFFWDRWCSSELWCFFSLLETRFILRTIFRLDTYPLAMERKQRAESSVTAL